MFARFFRSVAAASARPRRVDSRTGRLQFQSRSLRCEHLEDRNLLATTLPAGFQETLVASGLDMPTSLALAPDGRIFVTEKTDHVMIVKNGVVLATPFLMLPTESGGERGVGNVVLDPNFAQNGYVYVYYSRANGATPFNRLSRFTAMAGNPDVGNPASETVLLDNIQTTSPGNHNGGFMRFGSDGMLYLGIGDLTANSNVQDLSKLNGKILRLNVANYPNVIPGDNPFVNTPGARPEIFAYGFRNPFSGDIKPGTNTIYVNDVGEVTWEEIDSVTKGANYGWPLAEGNSANYANPISAYNHNGGSAAISGGSFYTGAAFPSQYANTYFFSDYVLGWIKNLNPATGTVTTFGTNVNSPVQVYQASDGSLYWVSIGAGSIYRITYANGNVAPTAVANATTATNGLAPLTVTFSGAGSSDPNGDALTYSWAFGDGTTGTGATVTHTYNTNGTYQARLTVNDRANGTGLSSTSQPIAITVGNRAPTGTITLPKTNTTYKSGDTISFAGSATDPENGTLPASAFKWSVVFYHQTHTHPYVDSLPGVTSGSFQIPLTGEVDPVQWYRINLTVTDSGGLQQTSYVDVKPQTSTFTLQANIAGLGLNLDGQPIAAPLSVTGVVNMTRALSAPATQTINGKTYNFSSWSDGGAATHNISTPATNTTYTANYVLAGTTALAATYTSNVPTTLTPGQTVNYAVTVTNTGTTTWSTTGSTNVRLGAYFNGTGDGVGQWQTEPMRFNLPSNVAPGASATINVTLTAPTGAGTYTLRNRLVQENVAWFNDMLKTTVTVGTAAPPLDATYTSNVPTTLTPGQTVNYTVTVTNTGSATWSTTGTNNVRLGAYFNGTGDGVGQWQTEPMRFNLPNNVAPGGTATINVTLTAPTTAGTYTLRNRLVQEGVAWFDDMLKTTITVGSTGVPLDATYSSNAPTTLTPGQTVNYTVTVTNTGTTTWSTTGTTNVRLGAYFNGTGDGVGQWQSEPVRFNLPNNVAPGGTATINVTLSAPTTAGTYTLRNRLVQENVAWFDDMLKTTVTVGAANPLDATYSSNAPTTVSPGQTVNYTVTVTNTGTQTWSPTGTTNVRLGAYFNGTSDTVGAWQTEPVRFNLPNTVAPGASATINVSLTAPATAGTYTLRNRLVQEGVAWFSDILKTTVTVGTPPTLSAVYSNNVPLTVAAGQTVNYTVTVLNTGTQTWNAGGTNIVRLGAYFNGTGDGVGQWQSEPMRFVLPNDVAPGATAIITVTLTAPTAKGTYTLRNRLVKENVAWFTPLQTTTITVN